MQLVKIESSKTTQLFWVIAAALAAVGLLTADQDDPGITAAGVLLALASMMPFYFWLLGWSHGLPIWPVFCLVLGTTYALPMIQNPEILRDYTAAEIILGGITTIGFILVATTVWLFMTSETPEAPRSILMIEEHHAVRYLLLFVAAGVLFGLNQIAGWIYFPGNLMSVVRGVVMSLNSLALFVLAYYHGREMLNKQVFLLFAAGAAATIVMGMTSLMLAQAIVPVAMVVFGYMLGSNRVPWVTMVVIFLVMAVLHAGKMEMRKQYWGEGGMQLSLTQLPQFYSDWFGYGMEELGGLGGVVSGSKREDGQSSVFERSGNLHMLLLVQEKSPRELPFLMGATYAPIPRLLLPRFIDDQKGISHAGNIMLSTYYGLQTEDQTRNTSIAWGLVPEAYANFGYLGIAGLAVVLGIFYSIVTKMSVGVPMTSLRFVVGLLIMAAATRADTMGVFVTTQFQGVVGVTLAAALLMRRQANPFAMAPGQPSAKAVEFGRRSRRFERPIRRRVGAEEIPATQAVESQGGAEPTLLEQFAPTSASADVASAAPAVRLGALPPAARSSLGVSRRRFPKWASAAQRAAIAAREEERMRRAALSAAEEEPARPRQVAVPHQHLSDWRIR